MEQINLYDAAHLAVARLSQAIVTRLKHIPEMSDERIKRACPEIFNEY